MFSKLDKLKLANEKFVFANNNIMEDDRIDVFNFIDKKTNVILTAPHATRSIINNKTKVTDLYTGSIVEYIGENNQISHIVKNKCINKETWLFDFVLENKIQDKYFIDIHGMKMSNDFHLAVGIGNHTELKYKEELSFISDIAGKYNIKFVINHPNYTGRPGLTGMLQKHNNTCKIMQLEWREDFRDIYYNGDIVLNRTIPFITDLTFFIEKLNKN